MYFIIDNNAGMQWFYYQRQVFVRYDTVVLGNFELYLSWKMYPINRNYNDAIDTWGLFY